MKPITFSNPPQFDDGNFLLWNLDDEKDAKTKNYESRIKDKRTDVRTFKSVPKDV